MTLTKDTKNRIQISIEETLEVLNWSLVFCKGGNEFTIEAQAEYCDNILSLCFDLECPDSGWYSIDVLADNVKIKELRVYIQK